MTIVLDNAASPLGVGQESCARNEPPASDKRPRKLAYNIPEFCQASGLGKTSIYEAIKSGKLKSVFVAGRRLILHEDGEAWLKSGRDAA